MKTMPFHKYRPYPPVNFPQRTWPEKTITEAPIWCSVDLRDGNQALINPMRIEQKMKFFRLLIEAGFKEIEVGFPSAATVEFDFTRKLIEENQIPQDVAIQVLCQCREHLIDKTFESLKGCRRAIFHLYNSTSELQRRVVFRAEKKEIMQIAIDGTRMVKERLRQLPGCDLQFQYSPESFTGTELDYSIEVCEAVMDVWQPTAEKPMILNLPATVEMSTPNIYADMIEYFCSKIKNRDTVIISSHNHNDRGCAIASTELAVMAGAQRVEGTLFGNGERTGNVDVMTLACNLYSQGVDPKLDFTDIQRVRKVAEECTDLPVHPRHPYAGDLVYTAFSGSHQDAINKGMNHRKETGAQFWEVPYLPIDPEDLGCNYEAVIRINSQSGKGGVAYILDAHHGFKIPRSMQIDFSRYVQAQTESTGQEVASLAIKSFFEKFYCNISSPYDLKDYRIESDARDHTLCSATLHSSAGKELHIEQEGNGPIDAFANGLKKELGIEFRIIEFSEHALESGSDARAACYVGITKENGEKLFATGIDRSTIKAGLLALLGTVNKL